MSRSSNKSSVFQERNLLAATGKDAIRNLLDPTSSLGIGEHTRVRRSLSVRCVTDGLCAATTSPSMHGDTWPPRRSHLGKQRCGTSIRSPQPRPCPLAQHYRSACCCQPQTFFETELWTLTDVMQGLTLWGQGCWFSHGQNVIMHWTPVFFAAHISHSAMEHFVYYCVKDLCTLLPKSLYYVCLKISSFLFVFVYIYMYISSRNVC